MKIEKIETTNITMQESFDAIASKKVLPDNDLTYGDLFQNLRPMFNLVNAQLSESDELRAKLEKAEKEIEELKKQTRGKND
jgi:hypothetical protein